MVKANIKETIEAHARGELPSRPYPTKKVNTIKLPKEKPKIIMEGISIITEQSKLTKKICPAFGIVKTKADSHYYFGTNLTCKVPIKFKGKISYKQDTFLVLIKDNRTKIICHSKNLQDYNYVLDETLLLKNSRWDLQHLHKWLADEDCTPKIEPMQPKELFKKIKEQFEFYLDLPEEEWYDYLTLWTIGTYFYSFFTAYPMVYLYGLKNTGKTKIMTLSSYLSFNGSMFIGITPATLFRLVEANKPSLFLDEIEKLLDKKREGAADIEAMLNSGYKKGATVPRCEKGKDNKINVKEYDVYCPKMFAHVHGKVSRTLISRCIRIVMQRANPNDKRGERWMEEHNPIWQKLRNELYIFALENWSKVLFYYEGTKEIKKEVDIDNRDWELWKPILVMAKIVDDDLYLKMNSFAKNMTNEYQKDEKEGWEYTIVKVLKENVDIERYYFVSEMRDWLINEYENIEEVPKTRSIGWELKRMGLTDRKREGNKGHKWFLNKKIVDDLVLKLGVTEETAPTNTLKDGVVGDVCAVNGGTIASNDYYNNRKKKGDNSTNTPLLIPPTELTPQTSLTTPKNIMTIIIHLSKKQDVIPIGDILQTANKAHISEEKVEEAIEHLKQEGMVYEPRSGFIQKL